MASEQLDNFEQFAIDVILERRKGKRARMLRAALWVLSGVFKTVVQTRLWMYRNRLLRSSSPGCLVISIGNLTVGGTGKTPVVELLARSLKDAGRHVAILSRGYKARKPPILRRLQRKWLGMDYRKTRVVHDGERLLLDSSVAGDEPFMLARSLGDVVVLVDKNRVRAALAAVRAFGCDTLLLDDGMQYAALRRRLDICLIDRQAPFGNEHLLPRGTLREPPANLRRASYIFITKCEDAENTELIERIRTFNKTAGIIECTHKALHLQNLYTKEELPLSWLKGRHIGALSGIARPESFEDKLTNLGAELHITARFADHHRFSPDELNHFISRCVRRDLEAVVTTEKDSVRFPHRPPSTDVPVLFLRVQIDILRGQEVWEDLMRRICTPPALRLPELVFA
ncbi:MAG: tetraacyldisaccharide 4'-kinase [Verrucomicrobia bacterium]|nr:tetraacyldisaccharide 4'-kinase [Verrucomicrobiota bacterium]